tara:strand:+ start:1380 stop:1613 length:234 start_codon:yes stop_codon:yes gene_type:complete
MPSYTYQFIETEEIIEVYQSIKEDTLTEIEHPETGKKMTVKKIFSAPAISGFTPTPATVAPTYRSDRSTAWNSAQIE